MGKDKTEKQIQGLWVLSFFIFIIASGFPFFCKIIEQKQQVINFIVICGLLLTAMLGMVAYGVSRNLLKRIKELENKVESEE